MCGHRRALLRRRGRLLSDATGASRRAAVHVRQLREEGHSRTAPYHRDPAHETEQWTITSSRDGTGLCLGRWARYAYWRDVLIARQPRGRVRAFRFLTTS